MRNLVVVTLIWAFSFSLIDVYLAGSVDSDFAVLSRVLLACAVFLPFTRWQGLPGPLRYGMLAVGALQFGVTYLFLYRSFVFLTAPEVMLFTILTPVYVTLFDDALRRRFAPRALLAALLAVAGAAVIRYDGLSGSYLLGFAFLQVANASFAAGQVGYRYVVRHWKPEVPHSRFFGLVFLGGLVVSLPSWLVFGDFSMVPTDVISWAVLVWLGLGASAAGLYLWNEGGTRVSAGTLAVMNNAVIPAGLLVNLLIWNRDADLVRLGLGGAIMALALLVNRGTSQGK